MNTRFLLLTGLVLCSTIAQAQAHDEVRAQAQREKQPLLDTLRDLVAIEYGIADIEGIRRNGTLPPGTVSAEAADRAGNAETEDTGA